MPSGWPVGVLSMGNQTTCNHNPIGEFALIDERSGPVRSGQVLLCP
jgi:hypothetical protein